MTIIPDHCSSVCSATTCTLLEEFEYRSTSAEIVKTESSPLVVNLLLTECALAHTELSIRFLILNNLQTNGLRRMK